MSHASENERVATDVAALDGRNIDQLRAIWRSRFGEPPPLRSGDLLKRCLAERIQTEAFGFDAMLEKELEALVRLYRRKKTVPQPKAQVRRGATLIREYAGQTHRVEALEQGFSWRGQTWKSLSEIAREITGVRWNGPRFFGLRSEPDPR